MVVAHATQRLQHYADHGDAPDDTEQRPALRAAQYAQRERRIGAGDQQKDRGMVEHLKHPLGATRWQRMKQRRGEIEQHHRRGKHTDRNDAGDVTTLRSRDDQQRKRDQRASQADT